jgi:archaellum component FlaF (FlaF/FlaG flagellin family)
MTRVDAGRAGSVRVRLAVVCGVLGIASAPTWLEAQTTTRVSVASDGTQGYADGASRLAISNDGRFIAFSSAAATLVPGDSNSVQDVFVHDRETGTTTRVSVRTGAGQADGPSSNPDISSDGRYVAFESAASNLVPGDTNGVGDVFVHDRATTMTSRVSVASGGAQVTGRNFDASISDDGRIVVFLSEAKELVSGFSDVVVHDRATSATSEVPHATLPGGLVGTHAWATQSSISGDGRFVLYSSVWALANPGRLAYYGELYDRFTGSVSFSDGKGVFPSVTANLGITRDGTTPDGGLWSETVSADERFVAFVSNASNLVVGDTNGVADVFVRDLRAGATCRVSVATPGTQADAWSASPVISGDGRSVAFFSASSNLVSGDTNSATDVFVHDLDGDDDTLPAPWEMAFGLDPRLATGDDGPDGDPDSDGRTNAQEEATGTHPRGFHTRYLAEGASTAFLQTRVALLSTAATNHVLLRFQSRAEMPSSVAMTLNGLARATLEAANVLYGAEFSTVIESDQPVVVDREMRWGQRSWPPGTYGTHAETAIAAPSLTWYVAEGTTHDHFSLFYLVHNPNTSSVGVTVTYLRPAPAIPLTRSYTVPAQSRFNIWVNDEAQRDPALAGLANTDVSARLVATRPVLVERAMYLDQAGPDGAFGTSDDMRFSAGHESAAVPAAALRWFLAEGATGPYFDEFILIANPEPKDANVEVRYLLDDGSVITKDYLVSGLSRLSIWVNEEEFPGLGKALGSAALSAIVTSANDVPVIVERAMWWPRPSPFWMEAHNSAGVTATGTVWGLAEGEVGGEQNVETYILIANTSPFAGRARVTLVFEAGGTEVVDVPLAPNSRTNVPAIESWFPRVTGQRFGALIESLGDTPAQIVVERAMYSDANGVRWAAGTNATATRLSP